MKFDRMRQLETDQSFQIFLLIYIYIFWGGGYKMVRCIPFQKASSPLTAD